MEHGYVYLTQWNTAAIIDIVSWVITALQYGVRFVLGSSLFYRIQMICLIPKIEIKSLCSFNNSYITLHGRLVPNMTTNVLLLVYLLTESRSTHRIMVERLDIVSCISPQRRKNMTISFCINGDHISLLHLEWRYSIGCIPWTRALAALLFVLCNFPETVFGYTIALSEIFLEVQEQIEWCLHY